MEDLLIFAIPLGVFVIVGSVAFTVVKSASRYATAALALLWAGFTGLMFFAMAQSTGWDGLPYLFALMGISAPSGLGLLVGGVTGLISRKRQVGYEPS